jgi:hypothetical protein
MAHVISHWLLTVEAQIQPQDSPCGICGGHVAMGEVSL